ncbi:hypothetical protein GCM10027160_07720 [Streptomyces calidiresistens]
MAGVPHGVRGLSWLTRRHRDDRIEGMGGLDRLRELREAEPPTRRRFRRAAAEAPATVGVVEGGGVSGPPETAATPPAGPTDPSRVGSTDPAAGDAGSPPAPTRREPSPASAPDGTPGPARTTAGTGPADAPTGTPSRDGAAPGPAVSPGTPEQPGPTGAGGPAGPERAAPRSGSDAPARPDGPHPTGEPAPARPPTRATAPTGSPVPADAAVRRGRARPSGPVGAVIGDGAPERSGPPTDTAPAAPAANRAPAPGEGDGGVFARWGVGTPVEEDRPGRDTDAGGAPSAEPAPRRTRRRRRGPIRVARDRLRAVREAVRRMLDRVDLWLERRYHAGARLVGRVPWHVPLIPWRRLAARSRARRFAATGLTRRQRLAPHRRRLEVAVATSSVVLCAVLAAAAPSPEAEAPARAAASGGAAERDPAAGEGPEIVPGAETGMERAEPTRVRIPWLRADVEVFGADLDPDGGPPSPAEEDAMRAAWYAGGVSPGERGAALLVGHLDTRQGPAAFAGLGMLEPGEIIEVDRADDTTAIFTVEAVEQYPKADFPDERVYGAVETPQLRLITCGGRWTAEGGYDANIVAYATLTDTVRHTD